MSNIVTAAHLSPATSQLPVNWYFDEHVFAMEKKLLFDAGLVPERIGFADDDRLPEWGFGVTNLVPRPTPGMDTIRPEEFSAGLVTLRRKVRRWKPSVVALVGVTLYRFVFEARGGVVSLGPQAERFEGARVWVLPNPSGRNANYSYAEMREAFASLRAPSRVPLSGQS